MARVYVGAAFPPIISQTPQKSLTSISGVGSCITAEALTGNLPTSLSERDLEDEFIRFGTLRSVWLARKPPGFAFVEFEDARDADDAVRKLDGFRGWRVEHSRNRGPRWADGPGSGSGSSYRGSGGGGGGRSPPAVRRRSPSYDRDRYRRRSPSYDRGDRYRRRSPSYDPPPRRRSPSYDRERSRSPVRARSLSRSPIE